MGFNSGFKGLKHTIYTISKTVPLSRVTTNVLQSEVRMVTIMNVIIIS